MRPYCTLGTARSSAPDCELTSVDGIILHTKQKEAEFFDETGRTGDNTSGTPGVTTQASTCTV